jgi:hypothetical protein
VEEQGVDSAIAMLEQRAAKVVKSALNLPDDWRMELQQKDPSRSASAAVKVKDAVRAFRLARTLATAPAPEHAEELLRVQESTIIDLLGGKANQHVLDEHSVPHHDPVLEKQAEVLLALHPGDNTVSFFSRAIERAALSHVGENRRCNEFRDAAKGVGIPFKQCGR